MSDLGRPALPDPQQDRHVAFPERTPEAADTAADGAAAGTGGGASAAGPPGLPADAWADHSSPTGAGPSSTWQPDPVVLRTPPTRPEARSRRRRPAWLPYAAIVGIFLVVSNGNNHDDVTVQRDGTFSSGQEQGGPPDPWG
ncbi:MAG TPA: hypothetical protein VFL38_09115, partial [Humibacillus xanthopallidus]|nr:hypothetical protein [Humibacillus xanthopallidus]